MYLRLNIYFLAMYFVQSLGILCCALCILRFLRSLLLLVSLIRNLEFEAAATLKMLTSLIATGAGKGALLPSRQRMEKEYQMAARCRLSSSAYYACSGYECSSDPLLSAVFLGHCFFFQKGEGCQMASCKGLQGEAILYS